MSYRKRQGRAICGVEMRLTDEAGMPVPRDDKAGGELEARDRGSPVAITVSTKTSDRFRDGWLRTGNVGHISPVGCLTLTDRSKDVIKSGGEWISSVELENTIMGYPQVAEAAVIAIPTIDGRTALAVVVRAHDSDVTAGQLREWVLAKCPDEIPRWLFPQHWTFVDQVPRTSVGKFDKWASSTRRSCVPNMPTGISSSCRN